MFQNTKKRKSCRRPIIESYKFLEKPIYFLELPYHGGITATGAALTLTIKALEKRRPNKRTLVILFTDGYTYDNWEEQSRLLLSKSVEVVVAGDVQSYLRLV